MAVVNLRIQGDWILYGFKNKYTQYIQSWPILPEGDCKIHASLNAYKMNGNWIPTYRMDEIFFNLIDITKRGSY